jgi:phosphopantetheinyl transferase
MQTKIEKISPLSAFAVYNIPNNSDLLTQFLSFREKLTLANISREHKRSEWLSARLAVKRALDCLGIPYPGFYKDEYGKSHAMNGQGFVSLTHTKGLAAAIFHLKIPVGIDLEYIRPKILRVGPKFLSEQELSFMGDDELLHTIAWSAKESIFKCQGKKGVSLKDHIELEPFEKNQEVIYGKIKGTEFSDHNYRVKVHCEGDFVLTYTIW